MPPALEEALAIVVMRGHGGTDEKQALQFSIGYIGDSFGNNLSGSVQEYMQ